MKIIEHFRTLETEQIAIPMKMLIEILAYIRAVVEFVQSREELHQAMQTLIDPEEDEEAHECSQVTNL